MGEVTANVTPGNLAQTLQTLAQIIHERASADPTESYTARLLQGELDQLLKKLGEESIELVMAVKDSNHNHIRYEAADLLYHLLVVLERCGISPEELAGELNARMV
ncbi:MAG: phosphoribosyl-ATP diphosphatase [Coriobacteriia bacterium]|nr:phosphoribosyl-ATP diphosphatase [Coriobacteriia bacterium]MCL2749914.1 phosphoribosyl-ATP diphosphatase [Coriobacteriia bacterium]